MRDRLDVQPHMPDPICIDDSLDDTIRNGPPMFGIEDGRLIGPNVIQCPTSWKFYRRPPYSPDRPVAITLHYTAILAAERPIVDLDKLLRKASIEHDAVEPLRDKLVNLGKIPDAVSLCLQNANKQRKASWCLCIGLDPTDDDLVFVAQYSPHLGTFGTMNAGPGKLWKWRKKYRGKTIHDRDGLVRWDGKEIKNPIAFDAKGDEQVIYTPNPPAIGIEIMNVGPLGASRFIRHPSWRRLPRKKYGSRWYHEPPERQVKTVVEVIRALVDEYEIDPMLIKRHSDYVPTKIDPEPPFAVRAIRRALTKED